MARLWVAVTRLRHGCGTAVAERVGTAVARLWHGCGKAVCGTAVAERVAVAERILIYTRSRIDRLSTDSPRTEQDGGRPGSEGGLLAESEPRPELAPEVTSVVAKSEPLASEAASSAF